MESRESVAGLSGCSKDDPPFREPSVNPVIAVPKKRGRPRKVAVEGEDKRRKQMKVRKKGNKKDSCPINGDIVIPRQRFFGENVNTKKMFLPEGWKVFAIKRSAGIHKGLYDLLYFAPNGGRLRSRNEVFKWVKENNSDIDPLKFLFSRTPEVLFNEENAKDIIFREAGAKGHTNRYTDHFGRKPARKNAAKGCNTIFSERGRELLLDDGSNSSYPQSFQGDIEKEGRSSGTLLKKQRARQRIPLEKTLDCLKSPYFSLKNEIPSKPVSIHAILNTKWIPPRSPYNLIQEDLYHNPWQLLIATIFLNCTSGKLAIPVIHEFLTRWPNPHDACSASLFDILDVVQILGLGRTRAATIIRFSHEFLTVDWKKPTELFGIGKYGYDSYKVFCLGQWKSVESEDQYLNLYLNWLHNVSQSSNSKPFSRGSTALVPK